MKKKKIKVKKAYIIGITLICLEVLILIVFSMLALNLPKSWWGC